MPTGEAMLSHHQPIEQTVERMSDGVRRLAAQLLTPVSADQIWTVLTDYDQLSAFIPNLASSRLLRRDDNIVHLQQEGCQQFLGMKFSASVELELEEFAPEGTLKFKMTKGDFRRFEGTWRLRTMPEATALFYELTVQGCLGMPIGLIEQRLRDDLTTNLKAVEAEARRRAAR